MKSPAFQWYVRDWLCSPTVRELHRRKDRSVAAYFFLLNEAWLQEPQATLPNDPDALADLARVTREEFDSFWPILKSLFESDGNGRIYNPRQFRCWMLQQKNRENGKKGGRPHNPNHNPSNNPNHNPKRKPLVEEEVEVEVEEEASTRARFPKKSGGSK